MPDFLDRCARETEMSAPQLRPVLILAGNEEQARAWAYEWGRHQRREQNFVHYVASQQNLLGVPQHPEVAVTGTFWERSDAPAIWAMITRLEPLTAV